MVCPKCRRIYPDGAERCAIDGAKLVASEGEQPTSYDEGVYDRTRQSNPPGPAVLPTAHARSAPRLPPAEATQPPEHRSAPEAPARADAVRGSSPGAAARGSISGAARREGRPLTDSALRREGRSLTDSSPRREPSEPGAGRSLTDSARFSGGAREVSAPRVVGGDLQISPGDMIADYQITGRIGEGGMGTVYAGIQPVIGKRVAIKVLLREFAANAEVVNRFIQEARAANQARSRYIVDIFSFGELNDGRHYFVMEHLDGRSLREVLKEKKTLSFDEGHAILSAMAKGLVSAHESGIIHRDIKPENIMVLREEDGTLTAKILDFGIAKLLGTTANPDFATKTGAAMGTPFYMSPEQCRGIDVDHRTDIYALGIIMFEMFAGQLPFKANSYIELVNKHLFASPPALHTFNPEVSAQLEAFVLRCIAKNPDERPQTMKQFLSELKELVPSLHRTHPSGALKIVPDPTRQKVVALGPTEEVVPEKRRRVWPVVVIVLGLLVLGGAGAGGYWYYRTQILPGGTGGGVAAGGGGTGGGGSATVGKGPSKTKPGVPEKETSPGPARDAAVALKAPARDAGPGADTRLREKVGRLVVDTDAERAVFYLDGAIVHQGRELRLDRVAVGEHALKIMAPGRETLETKITVQEGRELRLSPELPRKRGPGTKPGGQTKTKTKTTKTGGSSSGGDVPEDPDAPIDPFRRKKGN